VIIDHVNNYDVPDSHLRAHANEVNCLRALSDGLWFLYRNVKKVECHMLSQLHPNVRVFSAGNDPLTAHMPKSLIACSFHWYAVSACNVVGLLAWLMHTYDPSLPAPRAYMREVLPAVKVWRDKVAAHFARWDVTSRDSEAEQKASVLPSVVWSDDAFYVGAWTLRVKHGKNVSTSKSIKRWSLTKVHEQLSDRFWPGVSRTGEDDADGE